MRRDIGVVPDVSAWDTVSAQQRFEAFCDETCGNAEANNN
jgi:hypothetical protein